MTDTLLVEAAAGPPLTDDVVGHDLAGALLAAHADAGALVATLVDAGPVWWEQARPWVARLAAEGRDAERRLVAAPGGSAAGGDLAATDPAPPIVWAREVGCVQRRLARAVRACGGHGSQAAVLREAVTRTRAVVDGLGAVTPRV